MNRKDFITWLNKIADETYCSVGIEYDNSDVRIYCPDTLDGSDDSSILFAFQFPFDNDNVIVNSKGTKISYWKPSLASYRPIIVKNNKIIRAKAEKYIVVTDCAQTKIDIDVTNEEEFLSFIHSNMYAVKNYLENARKQYIKDKILNICKED